LGAWHAPDTVAAWLRHAERRNRMLASATERMFALASVREGARVLDAGTGTGDAALLLARRVGRSGEVVGVDVAPGMASAATEAVRQGGLANVTIVARDLGASLEDLGRFDAAVARKVIMLVVDPVLVVSRVREVLRPGARFAAVVWAELERNPFHATLIHAARGKVPVPAPEVIRAFSLSDPAAVARTFESASMRSVAVERVTSTREFESLAEAMNDVDRGPLYRELLSGLTVDERREAAGEIERTFSAFLRPDGRIVFPMESLVVAGLAG
jgi:ubiquinone/menaquinone biosynthesis C-methylase UbiE